MLTDEIAVHLIGQGVGQLDDTIFIGSSSVLPRQGTCLGIAETGGASSAKTQNDTATERPTLQLKAHSELPREARLLLGAAYQALGGANGLYNIWLSGVFYLRIVARQGPTDTGRDGVGRATYSFNIEIEKQPS